MNKAVIKNLISNITESSESRRNVIVDLASDADLKKKIVSYVTKHKGSVDDAVRVFDDTIVYFIQKVNNEEEIKNALTLHMHLLEIAKNKWNNNLQPIISDDARKLESEVRSILEEIGTPKRSPKYGPWIILSVFIAAMVISYIQWQRFAKMHIKYTHITETQYKAPPISDLNKDIIETQQDEMMEAIYYFDKRQLEKSRKIFDKIKPTTDSIQWYLAHIGWMQENFAITRSAIKNMKTESLKSPFEDYLQKLK